MFWKVILILVPLYLILKRWQKRKLYDLSNKLKSDYRTYPFIGHAYLLRGSDEERMKGLQLIGRDSIKHGGMSNFWLGGKYYVILSDADAIRLVLKKCLEKDDVVLFSRNLVGNGTIFASVPIWRPRRKVLAPTVHPKNLIQFTDIFAKQSSILVDQLQKVADTGSFSIWQYLTAYAMDSVCQTALGVHVNAQRFPDQPFLKAFDQCCRALAQRMVEPWLHPSSIYELLPISTKFDNNKRVLIDFIDKAIAAKRESMRERQNINKMIEVTGTPTINTFLDMLIEMSGGEKGYSDVELQEETLVIVLAGTDTSAVGASFTCSMLARHTDVQEKVYQELREVFGDSDREVLAEDLPRLEYLNAVIKETIRLYPPVPIIVRKVEKDTVLPSGLTLVKGSGATTHIWAVHRNPRYWGDDAEVFRPERFLKPLKYPNAYIPFSYGPRGCIGARYAIMSIKTALASVLRKYRIMPAGDLNGNTAPEAEPVRVTFNIMMKDADKFKVKLETRKKIH